MLILMTLKSFNFFSYVKAAMIETKSLVENLWGLLPVCQPRSLNNQLSLRTPPHLPSKSIFLFWGINIFYSFSVALPYEEPNICYVWPGLLFSECKTHVAGKYIQTICVPLTLHIHVSIFPSVYIFKDFWGFWLNRQNQSRLSPSHIP